MSSNVYAGALSHKLLSKEREQELLTQYAQLRKKLGVGHAKVIALRNQIVQFNLRLIAKHAQRYKRLPLEDLMGEGVKGLIIAVERFEVERGLRFGTFAQFWVRHKLQRACEDISAVVRIPVHVQAKRRRGEGKREGVDIDGPPLSLDAPLSDDGGRSLHDVLSAEDEVCADDELGHHLMSERVRRAVFAALDPREREVIESRFLRPNEETLREVGERLDGISRERVRQIENEALGKMRRALERLGAGKRADV